MMPIDQTAYARTIFQNAAFRPEARPALVNDLYADPSLRAIAVAEVSRITEGQTRGMLMDRDHISRITHQTLTQALAQVDALIAAEPPATIEDAAG